VVGLLGAGGGVDQRSIQLVSQVLGILLAILVYQAMLPTTLGRAALVWLFQLLIILAIVIVIVAIIFGVGFAFRLP